MALKTKPVNDFTKLVDANTNRVLLPPGALPRASNVLGTFPGELTTCDGTRVISAPPASTTTYSIVAIGQVFPVAGQSTIVGLTHDGNGNFQLLDMQTSPWSVIGTFSGNKPTLPPQIVGTNSGIAILTDFGNPVRQWSGISGALIEVITNTFDAASVSAIWQSLATYPAGQLVIPETANGYYYMASPGGVAGSNPPSFSTVVGSVTPDGPTGLAWQNMGSVTALAPPGAMCGIYYSGSLWLWGVGTLTNELDQTGYSALWMSDVQDVQSYNPLNQTFIAEDDGTTAMGMSTMSIAAAGIAPTSALVIFKYQSTFQFQSVFGSPYASLVPAQTNMGCVAPRTIQFMSGVGVLRMTHQGVAVFDGERDILVSNAIRPYLFGGDPTITAVDWDFVDQGISSLVVNPQLYVMGLPTIGNVGAISRLFVYDFILSAQGKSPVWTIVDLPFFISSMSQILTPDATPMTVMGGYSDGNLRRWQEGDDGWDTDTVPVQWSFESAPVSTDPTERVFVRWLQLKMKNVNGNAKVAGYPFVSDNPQNGMSLTFALVDPASPEGQYGFSGYGDSFYQGVQQPDLVTLNISRTGYNVYMKVTGSGLVRISGMIWRYTDKPAALMGKMC